MEFIEFNDRDNHLIAINEIRYIKKSGYNLACFLKDDNILIQYNNIEERNSDYKEVKSLLKKSVNKIIPNTETVKGMLNTVKTKATETFNKTIEEPTGFYFEKDFNGVLSQFRKGEIANIIFKDNAYYVINKKGIKLFKAISEEGFKYGKLVY